MSAAHPPRLGYLEVGDGPTLVAVHGGLLGGRLTFGPVLSSWSQRLHVLVPDRRGYELTPRPASGTLSEQAGDLLAFVDERAGGRAHLLGFSVGGVIALTALQQRPDAFRSLTLVEAPALTVCHDRSDIHRFHDFLQRLHAMATPEAPQRILREFLELVDPRAAPGLLALQEADDAGLRTPIDELRVWDTPLTRRGVTGIGVPALVVSGDRSAPVMRTIGDDLAEALGAEHLVVRGAGHAAHLAADPAGGINARAGEPVRAALCRHVAHAEAAQAHLVPIELADPDPAWPARFAAERDVLASVLPAGRIEHVGSTAVAGLAAKPVIDILVGVPQPAALDAAAERLEALGYSWWRDDPDRRRRYLLRSADGVRTHHVHVTTVGGAFWDEFLTFRDRLRDDADLRDAYASLKRGLAERHRTDRDAYSQAKTDFVRSALG